MNKLLLSFWLLLSALPAFADKFSYLYIQGDQKTPFYVKLDDAMQPRFGKNYCIVPKLAPGPIHIEILFQQNKYPAQQFNIQIPEDGSRGFLLVNSKDSSFQLYDLQQGFYLEEGNEIGEDRIPVKSAPAATPVTATSTTTTTVKPAAKPAQKPKATAKKPVKTAPPKSDPVKAPAAAGTPVFINDLELSHKPDAESDSGMADKVLIEDPITGATFTVGTCSKALTTDEFEPVFNTFSQNNGDEGKLEYLYTQLEKCYETWQVRALAERLQSDAARFELFKKVYPRVTDKSAFSLLDDLLADAAWKAEFEKLIHH